MTSASREMDSGAALRASAISPFRSSVRYWSRGAMLGYFAFPSWAVACHAVANISAMAMLAAIELAFLLCIVSLRQISKPNCSGEAYLAKNRDSTHQGLCSAFESMAAHRY